MSPKGDEVSASDENEIGHMRNGRTTDTPNEAESVSCIKLSEGNGGSFHQTAYDASSNRGRNPAAGDFVDGQIQTPNQLNNVNKEFTEVGSPRDMKKLELTAVNGKVLPEFNSEALQFNVFVQHEPAYQHSSQGMVQEYSLKEKTYNKINIWTNNIDHRWRGPYYCYLLDISNRFGILLIWQDTQG
ncbi:hypothetical protein ACFXTO_024605 [Malus domestica]